MALTPHQVRELERLGIDNVRERLRMPVPVEGSLCRDLAMAKCCAAT